MGEEKRTPTRSTSGRHDMVGNERVASLALGCQKERVEFMVSANRIVQRSRKKDLTRRHQDTEEVLVGPNRPSVGNF